MAYNGTYLDFSTNVVLESFQGVGLTEDEVYEIVNSDEFIQRVDELLEKSIDWDKSGITHETAEDVVEFDCDTENHYIRTKGVLTLSYEVEIKHYSDGDSELLTLNVDAKYESDDTLLESDSDKRDVIDYFTFTAKI